MNAYTQTKLALMTPQQKFPRPLLEGLMAEHEALRAANASLRGSEVKMPEYPADVIHNGKKYMVEDVQRLHKIKSVCWVDGKNLKTRRVPLVIVTEK